MKECRRQEESSGESTHSSSESLSNAGKPTTLSRRELLKQALIAGAFIPQGFGGFGGIGGRGGGARRGARTIDPSQIPTYKYRTLPATRLPALQAEYDKIKNSGTISRSKAFLDQLAPLSFSKPADFSAVKSVVVLAAFAKPMYVNFKLDGNSYRVLVPPQYYTDDLNAASLKNIVEKDIIKSAGSRVVDITDRIPLKLLAARSGLGYYGRNNLIFVDGMGSYNLLYAFITDHQFPDDGWTELSILERCRRCDHCDRICPTESIQRSNFLLNIDKCLTLYNENLGTFPNWMPRSAHHALMGCLKCQSPCPINGGIADLYGTMEDVSEEETRKILKGTQDEPLLKSLQRKLRQFPAVESKELFPILTRNLSLLVRSQV
jgi:epoxyqueuosine reductase